jgi:hypothetical protein
MGIAKCRTDAPCSTKKSKIVNRANGVTKKSLEMQARRTGSRREIQNSERAAPYNKKKSENAEWPLRKADENPERTYEPQFTVGNPERRASGVSDEGTLKEMGRR